MTHESLAKKLMDDFLMGGGGVRDVVSVYLDCICCGKVEEINVFRERRLPTKVYWECFDCQKREGGAQGGKKGD